MRQLFKRTLVLLPLLALLAAPATGFGQSGRAWSERLDTIPGNRMPDGNPAVWGTILPMAMVASGVLGDWNSAAADDSKWHSNDECQAAMGYTRDAIQNAYRRASAIQAGLTNSPNLFGEYFGDEDVIVISAYEAQTAAGFGTLIHEAWHRSTGYSDLDIDTLNTRLLADPNIGRAMESCHDEAREEEEDEEEGNGGGSGGGTCEGLLCNDDDDEDEDEEEEDDEEDDEEDTSSVTIGEIIVLPCTGENANTAWCKGKGASTASRGGSTTVTVLCTKELAGKVPWCQAKPKKPKSGGSG